VDYEQRDSGGNVCGFYQYDRVFDHDVPDMVVQYIMEGNWDVARQITAGATCERLPKGSLEKGKYNEAIPKYLTTMVQYLQVTGDKTFFTKELIEKMKRCARAVQDMRKDQLDPGLKEKRAYGLILRGNTLDNQTAPYHWGENFHKLQPLSDWTRPEVDLETWGWVLAVRRCYNFAFLSIWTGQSSSDAASLTSGWNREKPSHEKIFTSITGKRWISTFARAMTKYTSTSRAVTRKAKLLLICLC
jgi:hypothetical protein